MSPIFLWMIMLFVVLILGCFMDVNSIMMITLPIYMPVVNTLGINPLLFGVTMLICLEVGCITPPFGVILFAMSGVVPKDITLGDIYRAGVPFIICDLVGVAVIMAFPILALWLPSIMIQ
jgi:TRAP-type C4-dicarboxylate transport system permease large subunit